MGVKGPGIPEAGNRCFDIISRSDIERHETGINQEDCVERAKNEYQSNGVLVLALDAAEMGSLHDLGFQGDRSMWMLTG